MTAKRRVVVTIPANPEKQSTTVTTEGFVGESCRTATDALEGKLGKVVSDEPTDEMYATDKETEGELQL